MVESPSEQTMPSRIQYQNNGRRRSEVQHGNSEEAALRRGSTTREDNERYLSEIAAPPPVDYENVGRRRSEVERGDSEEAALRRASTTREDNEKYLSEVAAPAPVEYKNIGRRRSGVERGGLEEAALKRASTSNDQKEKLLSEVAAPPLIPHDDDNWDAERSDPVRGEEYGTNQERESFPPEPCVDSSQSSDHASRTDLGQQRSPIATQIYTISYLIFFAIFGTLARIGLQALTLFNGAPITFSLVWPNFAGSLIMGFLVEDRCIFRQEWGTSPKPPADDSEISVAAAKTAHGTVKKTIPLYIGLTTGFCGCFTSFSGFMRDSFLAMSNRLPVALYHPPTNPNAIPATHTDIIGRAAGYSFMALCAELITTICLCLGAVVFGAHLALFLAPVTPTLPFRFTRRILDPIMVFVAFGCWLGAVLMAIWPPDRFTHSPSTWRSQAIFPIVFAPLGCLARYYASLHLNGRIPSFPLGTFFVNIVGTMIVGMSFDLQHVPLTGGAVISCQVLQGVENGFCGCLTTISTWVTELRGLRKKHSYVYGCASVGVGLCAMIAEIGPVRWSASFQSAISCKT